MITHMDKNSFDKTFILSNKCTNRKVNVKTIMQLMK
jgi:hypothetical protein